MAPCQMYKVSIGIVDGSTLYVRKSSIQELYACDVACDVASQ